MGRILRWGLLQLCQSLVNGLHHQVIHKTDHMSDLHVDCSFHKQSTKIDNNLKIKE